MDRKSPRDKSVYKLLHFDCDYRVIVLRDGLEQEPPPGIDAVVPLALTETPDLFETFWRAYPKKINKQKAHEAFAKLHISPETLQAMLQAIEQQKRAVNGKSPMDSTSPMRPPGSMDTGGRMKRNRCLLCRRTRGRFFSPEEVGFIDGI